MGNHLRPIGSEKLEGMDKIQRIMEIARYNENIPTPINEDKSTEYTKTLADGRNYQIIKEKNGYVIKRTINESTNEYDYLEPMKNRKYYSSYSQAFKRLNLVTKEVNIKNADKDLMEHLQPKRYTSLLSSGDQGHVHSLKHIKSKQSKIKMPIRTIDKEIKVAKTHNMFDWFPMLVNKIHKDGINVTDKLSTSPGEVVKQLKLGNENLYSYIKPDGSIKINVQSPHASNIHPETKMGSFSMEYDPPKISLDKHADVAMHIPASFKFIENNREVHPNNATSDTLPLESKLTGRHISALRNYKK